jgi:hypothetical protein
MRQVLCLRCELGPFPTRMVPISFSEKSATTWGGFEKHTIATWIRRTIRHTVLHDVNIDTGANCLMKTLHSDSINNFLDGEILHLWLFAMEKSDGYPDFIRNPKRSFGRRLCHKECLLINY